MTSYELGWQVGLSKEAKDGKAARGVWQFIRGLFKRKPPAFRSPLTPPTTLRRLAPWGIPTATAAAIAGKQYMAPGEAVPGRIATGAPRPGVTGDVPQPPEELLQTQDQTPDWWKTLTTPYAIGKTGLTVNPLGGIIGGLGGLGLGALMGGREGGMLSPILTALLLGGAGAVLPGMLGSREGGAAA